MNTLIASAINFAKQSDKQRHFEVCFGLTMAMGYLLLMPLPPLVAVTLSAVVVLAVGFGKEVYDKRHPLTHTADWFDFLADAMGVAGACLVLLAPLIYKHF
jgi:hypothetical protein